MIKSYFTFHLLCQLRWLVEWCFFSYTCALILTKLKCIHSCKARHRLSRDSTSLLGHGRHCHVIVHHCLDTPHVITWFNIAARTWHRSSHYSTSLLGHDTHCHVIVHHCLDTPHVITWFNIAARTWHRSSHYSTSLLGHDTHCHVIVHRYYDTAQVVTWLNIAAMTWHRSSFVTLFYIVARTRHTLSRDSTSLLGHGTSCHVVQHCCYDMTQIVTLFYIVAKTRYTLSRDCTSLLGHEHPYVR